MRYRQFWRHGRMVALTLSGFLLFLNLSGCRKGGERLDPSSKSATPAAPRSGPYLGSVPPGAEPRVFASGVVSTGYSERDLAMMPDGSEIYWSVTGANYRWTTILRSRMVAGVWTEPEVAPCCRNPAFSDLEPHITPDGRRFLWLSDRPGPGSPDVGGQDIWAMDREGDDWGEPYPLPEAINSQESEYFPSVTWDGTLYFTRGPAGGGENRIYRSRWVNGAYLDPEPLPQPVNAGTNRYNAFVDPDEEYLILGINGLEDTMGGTDYYIVFRNEQEGWIGPFNLGPRVNTAGSLEFSPYVSPDGRFFFFMTVRPDFDKLAPRGQFQARAIRGMIDEPDNGAWDIYWMDASFIEELRPDG